MRKQAYIFALLILPVLCSAQVEKGTGVFYFSGEPTLPVTLCYDGEVGIDASTGFWWEYSRDFEFWVPAGFRVQLYAPCEAPTYTPADKQSHVVLNSCDSLYRWRDGAWRHLNPSGAVNTDTSGYNLDFFRSNDTIYITDGDGTLFVTLPPPTVNTDTSGYNLDFSISGDTLYLTDGAGTLFVELPPGVVNTDTSGYNLAFSISGDTIYLTDGAGTLFVELPPGAVNTDTSGYNLAFFRSNDTLYITDGNATLFAVLATPDGSETIVNAGTGISVSGVGTIGNPYVVTNTGDLSSTNELQTLNSTGDATSHTVALSDSGGSVKFKEGANILLTTDVTGLNAEVTISADIPAGLNGIYGDGTAGSGSDALPPGGSEVTIPGVYQPLNFLVDASAGNVFTALQVTTDYTNDDAYTHYLLGKSPTDSFSISAFDQGTTLWAQAGILTIQGDEDIAINSLDRVQITGDSVLATATTATAMPWITGEGASGYMKRIQGASNGQILKWNGTNWALASDETGGGTIDGAENGLNVVSNKVRLGGTLLTQTNIEQAGFGLFHNNGKWSHSTNTLFAFTPTQGFGVMGTEGDPTTSGSPTLDGIMELRAHASNSEQPNSLTIGAYTTNNQGVWAQSRSHIVPNFHYPLQLNPRGGPVSVGRGTSIPTSTFTVTATGITGSTASGRVLLLENVEGATVGAAFGTGGDNIGAELTWRSADNAFRVTNRSTTTNARVTVSVGGAPEAGDASDRAHFIATSAASKVRAGFGTTVANTHSTVQSAGSMAAPVTLSSAGTLTLNETHYRVIHTLNSTPSWTLPAANTCAGREYIIHHFGSSGQIGLNENVVSSTGTTFNNVPARHWAYIFSDGSSWRGYRLQSL
jgi:hypothetical protein